jgi:hypothetical protein
MKQNCILWCIIIQAVFSQNTLIISEENMIASTKENFYERLPDNIKCVDIGCVYQNNGIPLSRNEELYNNIIPEWEFSLAAYPLTQERKQNDLRMILIGTKDSFNEYNAKRKANPLPLNTNLLWIDVDSEKLSIATKMLGLYFCEYPPVNIGDVFPFLDTMYYVKSPYHVKKLKYDDMKYPHSFPCERTRGTLCIPLISTSREFANGGFTYLPGLNAKVVRIYQIPANNEKGEESVARVCTTEKIVSVSGYEINSHEVPGSPVIEKTGNREEDINAMKLQVQEVHTGDLIKGMGVAYKVTSIVPQDSSNNL